MSDKECEEQVRFWIITRSGDSLFKNGQSVLGLFGKTRVVGIPADEDGIGGGGVLKDVLKEVCHGEDALRDDECFWIIDEALAFDWISMASLMEAIVPIDPDFAIHSQNPGILANPLNLFCGIVRMKAGLARRMLDCSESMRCLVVHGMSAAVAALGMETAVLEWGKHEGFRRFFHPAFPYCEGTGGAGICFPVLDSKSHAAVCSLNLDLAERIGSRVESLVGSKTRGWFVEDVARWQKWFGRQETTRILEISAVDGISCIAMLDLLFPNPESEAHCIHAGEASPGGRNVPLHLAANAGTKGCTERLHLYAGQPVEVLGWMIAGEGYWESFDFIHLRPAENHVETMTSVGQAWSLLKPGGVILLDSNTMRFGESHPSKLVLETCARVIGNQADPLLMSEIIALKKRPPLMVEGEGG